MTTLIPKFDLKDGGSTPAGAVNRAINLKLEEFISVADFGATGDGTTDDTVALQAAFTAMSSYSIRSLYFPPGTYLVSSTLMPPTGLTSAQFIGASGYDGIRGPINDSLRTAIKWTGATSTTTAVVKFNQGNGIVWSGISINCDYKAGYGLQFMSSTTTGPSAKNIVQNCTFNYATADGIIIGEDGVPTASPGQRQFFGNAFYNLTFLGCARSGIHVNEWNADQQYFENVQVFLDDAASPQNTLYGFWFDYGGQSSTLVNCETGGLTVVGGNAGSGYSIFNKGNGSTTNGAFGLTVINFWQEGAGGLYYGITSTNDNKAFSFLNCKSFTGDTANPSVYIDKGTASQIPYTFVGCTFLSNLFISSSTFSGQYLNLTNCIFASTFGVLNYNSLLTTNGRYLAGTVSITAITIPAYANFVQVTLGANVNTVYAENLYMNSEMTVIVTQDATGGRTLTWGGGQFSNLPAIPAPNSAPGTKTVYTFISDGTYFYLKSAQL